MAVNQRWCYVDFRKRWAALYDQHKKCFSKVSVHASLQPSGFFTQHGVPVLRLLSSWPLSLVPLPQEVLQSLSL